MTGAIALALLLAGPAPFSVEAVRLGPGRPEVVLAPRPGERAVLVVRFHAGAVDDGDAAGLTRVAQHALVEASRRLRHADLVRALFAADATLALETGLREATFVLEADRRGFDRLAAVLLDLLLQPDLDPVAFERARERAMHDERESSGRRDLVALLAPKAIDDWRYGSPPYGERQTLENVTARDVRRHLEGPLSPSNATVVAAGAFDARALRAALTRLGARGSHAPPPRPRLTTPFSLQVPAQRELYLVAWRGAFDDAERSAAARLVAALLGERIHRALRERGVGYATEVVAEHRRWLDLLLVALPAHEPTDLPLGTLLDEEVAAVAGGRFTDEELARNRAWTLAELAHVDADPEALARTLADGVDAAWFGPEVAARLAALDRPALSRLAPELLSERAAVRVLYTRRAASRGAIPESFRRPRSAP